MKRSFYMYLGVAALTCGSLHAQTVAYTGCGDTKTGPCQAGGDPTIHTGTVASLNISPIYIQSGNTIVAPLSDDEKKQLADAKTKVRAAELDQTNIEWKIEMAHLPKEWNMESPFCVDCWMYELSVDKEHTGFFIVSRLIRKDLLVSTSAYVSAN